MARAKESQILTPEQHLKNLEWLKDTGRFLDTRQWADYQRLKKELNQPNQARRPYSD